MTYKVDSLYTSTATATGSMTAPTFTATGSMTAPTFNGSVIGSYYSSGTNEGTSVHIWKDGSPGFTTLNSPNGGGVPGAIIPAIVGTPRNAAVNLGTDAYYWRTIYVGTIFNFDQYYLSDDRLKTNETFVENATDTLLKLKPQTYDKHSFVYDRITEEEHSNVSTDGLVFSSYSNSFVQQSHFHKDTSNPEYPWRKRSLSDEAQKETGLIAQDIWYDTPELRHIVSLASDANPSEEKPVGGEDPQQDPDYDQAGWGTTEASVSYTQLIPLLIKSNQELHERIKVLEAHIVVSN